MKTQFSLYRFLAITVLACSHIRHLDALRVNANIVTDNMRGSDATLTCSWTKDSTSESLIKFIVGSLPDTPYFVVLLFDPNQSPTNHSTSQSDRLTLDPISGSSATMRLRDLQCMDEKTYYCTVEYFNPGSGTTNNAQANGTRAISGIKIAPRQPTLTTVPATLTSGIEENNEVRVTCQANIGRPGRGRIVWKVFRGNNPENIDASDTRISSSTAGPQGDEDSCTQRKIETFTMTVNRSDQDLVVACFVLNDDFPPSAVPTRCGNSQTDRCAQTENIKVLYGVSTISVTREPQSDLYVGGSVTLKCFSDGYPPPTYTWVKVDDADRELNAEMSDSVSQVKLQQLNDGTDGGDYNCTASNEVNGRNFSVVDSVNISIYQTTTRPPTTTPPEITTEPGTGGTAERSGDDDDNTTIIIVVCVVVGVVLLVAAIAGFIIWRKRNTRKEIEEPPEKPYNNRTNLGHHGGQPDLVADDKKFHNSSLNNSFGIRNESFDMMNDDGLKYADLTYDNRPRSRKPMAINDAASDYSDIQMPEV